METPATTESIRIRYMALRRCMDERMRRLWAAAEVRYLGRGGISLVNRATGMSPNTIKRGMSELEHLESHPDEKPPSRIRRPGGGRKYCTEIDAELGHALNQLIDPVTRGDPQSPLRWTCKSTVQLSRELTRLGHPVSPRTVGRILRGEGYSLQGNRKTKEGSHHPDRNAQFEFINATALAFAQQSQPLISVDTKKKELIGPFKNGGREWYPCGAPEEVMVHDFMDKELGKAIPYGVYDISKNEGWVSVGIDHDTAHFAVEAIRRWWKKMGIKAHQHAEKMLITADGGGSNGSRCRLWKVALQGLADDLGFPIYVCHLPPGTSKWNKIEHRMFCHITQNWRGRPLISHEVIVNLIANTSTEQGLCIQAELDDGVYPVGIKVSDEELGAVNLTQNAFHGDWNYCIAPKL